VHLHTVVHILHHSSLTPHVNRKCDESQEIAFQDWFNKIKLRGKDFTDFYNILKMDVKSHDLCFSDMQFNVLVIFNTDQTNLKQNLGL